MSSTTSVLSAFEAGASSSSKGVQDELEKESVIVNMAMLLHWGFVSEPGDVSAVNVFRDPVFGWSVFGLHVQCLTDTSFCSGSGFVGLSSDGLVHGGYDGLLVEGLQPQPKEFLSGSARVFLSHPVNRINVVGQIGSRLP